MATDLSLLIDLKERNYRPARIATIGRLSLCLHPAQIKRLAKIFPDAQEIQAYRWGDPCEPVLKAITGATEVVSFDFSDYEGATVVHDMNLPLPPELSPMIGSFDLVIDGGSLEHIFNFPVAVANLMALCRVGGFVLSANPANNLCGHGFYQFTPELMYRLYAINNGFAVECVLLTVCNNISVERARRPRSFRVPDPADLGNRITICNWNPTIIRTLARKVADISLDSTRIQQSDYAAMWVNNNAARTRSSRSRQALRALFLILPAWLQALALNHLSHSTLRLRNVMPRWQGALE